MDLLQEAPARVMPPTRYEDPARCWTLGADHPWTADEVEQAATDPQARFQLAPAVYDRLARSREALETLKEAGTPIYGVTTGFGPFVQYGSAEAGGCAHGSGLIAHLTAGSGALAPPHVVRATMILRTQALTHGYSAVRPEVLQAYLHLLERNIIPAVPEIGSVGASGDLTPLAHIARVLTGEGYVLYDGERLPARGVLRAAGIEPIELEGRDALALVNGTTFMTAYAALAVAAAERLVARAEALTGWIYRLLGCRAQALHPRLHEARGHAGQQHSAANIREEAARYGDWEDTTRPLQEVYSFRCAPQVLGACRENLAYAHRIVETEMNGVSDNPLIFDGGLDGAPMIAHGGNFQGQQVGFAADALNQALVQVGVLAERQVAALLNPQLNQEAPLLLAWNPGPQSGLAGAQLTSTALVAEMRHHAHPCAIQSISTNGGNQDVVSMGTMAARQAYGQIGRLTHILAVVGIALTQLTHLRTMGRAEGRLTPVPGWMPTVEPLEEDRGLWEDIERVGRAWA
ncbi:MAG: aromatic amino acid ammonia-lyase [Bacteroidota bacterium]